MEGFKDIESPTRVYRLDEKSKLESKVVSAKEAKDLFRNGWYPRRKKAIESKKK